MPAAAGTCSASSLNGTYLHQFTGTVFSGANPNKPQPAGIAAVGLLTLNNGADSGSEASSNSGVLSPPSSDCQRGLR
jgi:hypothetical protein